MSLSPGVRLGAVPRGWDLIRGIPLSSAESNVSYPLETDYGKEMRLLCDLSVLTAAQRRRRASLNQLLQVGTVDVVELPDGYAFHVDPVSIIAQCLEEFAVLERLCCPFMTIAVRTGTVGAQPLLEIGGGDGVKKFIAAEFGIGKQPTP